MLETFFALAIWFVFWLGLSLAINAWGAGVIVFALLASALCHIVYRLRKGYWA
jgi:hypothetical protein